MFPHHFHIVKRKKNKSACFLPARKILPAGQKKKKVVLRVQPSAWHWLWLSQEKLINTSALPPGDLPFPLIPVSLHISD